jgi:hypothetical protein
MTKCKAFVQHDRLHTITSEQEESKNANSTPSFIKHAETVLDEAAIEEKVREFFRGQAVRAHTQTHFRVVEELAPDQPLPQQVSKRRKWKVDKAI